MGALAEHIRHFADPGNVPARQDFDQYFVAQRVELHALDGAASNHEVAAHGIGDSAHHPGKNQQADELCGPRHDAAGHAPVAHPSALEVPARDGDVGAALDDPIQRQGDIRRVLQIGIDHAQHFAAGRLPAADDGGGQSALLLTAHDAKAGALAHEFLRQFPGSIRAVVVDDDDFVAMAKRLVEQLRELRSPAGQCSRPR